MNHAIKQNRNGKYLKRNVKLKFTLEQKTLKQIVYKNYVAIDVELASIGSSYLFINFIEEFDYYIGPWIMVQ